MGSYLSSIYYETPNDLAAVPRQARQQDDPLLLAGKKPPTTSEISGIHQHKSLEVQKTSTWKIDKQFCLNDTSGVVADTKCLGRHITLCTDSNNTCNSAGQISYSCESRNNSVTSVESAECLTATAVYNPRLYPDYSITESVYNDQPIDPQSAGISTSSKENLNSSKVPSSRAWEIDITDNVLKKKKKRKQKGSGKGNLKKPTKKNENIKNEQSDVIGSYTNAVSVVTQQTIALRKVFDQRRWYCMSRPQYSKSCGISSLVSCWNYLFSTLGTGSLQPISQEEAMTVLGFKPPFGEIRFGPFTGNATLMRWFHQLCNNYNVRGRAYYLYKPKGKSRTVGITSEGALHKLKNVLQDEQTAVIYHCHNHYFCPVGYEDTPIKSLDAYRTFLPKDETITWVLLCDPSSKHPAINSIRWNDIDTDLNCENPHHKNIRKLYNGVMERKTKKVGGNLHCLMVFQRSTWQGVKRGVVTNYQETSLEINNIDSESDESTEDSDD